VFVCWTPDCWLNIEKPRPARSFIACLSNPLASRMSYGGSVKASSGLQRISRFNLSQYLPINLT